MKTSDRFLSISAKFFMVMVILRTSRTVATYFQNAIHSYNYGVESNEQSED